jgi:hypothetical protein
MCEAPLEVRQEGGGEVTHVVWRVEDDDPDRRVWKFTRDAYPMRSLP